MAELGAIAAVVQLVDVALRVSGEIRGFLDAYKDTGSDVKALRDSLRDVEANVRNLVKYITEFKKSRNAVDEFEVLSEAIVNSLEGYDEDVLVAKKLLPSKPAERIKERMDWVLHKGKAQNLTRKLNERNSRLTTALGIVGRLHDLRVRQDTSQILEGQVASRKAASNRLNVLNQSIRKQDDDHAELLSQSRTINININAIQASSTSEHEALASDIYRQSMVIDQKFGQMDKKNSLMIEKMRRTETTLDNIQSQAQRMTGQSTRCVNRLAADVHEIHTQTTFIASSVDMSTKILREELRTTLKPIVEQAFTASDSRNEARMQRMEDLIQQAVHDLRGHARAQQSQVPPDITSQEVELSPAVFNHSSEHFAHEAGEDANAASIATSGQHTETGHSYTVSTYKRKWFQRWKIGSLGIEITQVTRRIDGLPLSNSTMKIQIHFRPIQTFVCLPGISVLYDTAPNSQGYYQLAPMISTFPIIDYDHPVLDVVCNGNVEELQSMLASGEAHLRCQNKYGLTLLHYAALFGYMDACEFLARQGLSWNQTVQDRDTSTPLHLALGRIPDSRAVRSLRPIETLCFLENMGCDIDNTFLDFWAFFYYYYRYVTHPELVSEVCRALRDRPTEVWRSVFSATAMYCLDSELDTSSLSLMKILLSEGLDPSFLWRGHENSHPLLWWALKQTRDQKDMSIQPQPVIREPETESTSSRGNTVALWCILETLLNSGADMYYLDPEDFDRAKTSNDMTTHCTEVYRLGIAHEWRMALEECGFDPDKVYLEDDRRCKQAFRLRGASRSGIDEEVLELPPIDGLRCRICRTSWCSKHHPSDVHHTQNGEESENDGN